MKLRTLRGRLAAAMLLILIIAVAVSSLLDSLSAGRTQVRNDEPYQDAFVLAGFCLPALLLIWLVSSWSLRPLARISQQVSQMKPADVAFRLSPEDLPAEIVPLVDAVNGALDRMGAAFAAERRFTENAAHELRTPLAVLSLRLQRARQAEAANGRIDWAAIDRDVQQLNRLVGQMLDLARQEHAGRRGREGTAPVVNISRLAREAAASILPMIEGQHRSLELAVPEMAAVRGDAEALRDAVRNLLENAVLHGAGKITLIGSADASIARFTLTVRDDGQGFAPADTEVVFKRFHKGRASQGTGLGLAIVREVIRNHGGDVIAFPGPPGKIEMILPLQHT